jgi:hypothetical protein
MDTVTAVDAFVLVDNADAVFIVGDGAYRTGLLTGTFQVNDRIIRTGLCTLAALTAFGGIDMGSVVTNGNGVELTGIFTGLTHTFPAVVGYRIRRNRTLLTGRAENLYNVCGVISRCRVFALRETDSLFYQFPVLIYTAAVFRQGTGNQLVDQFLFSFFVQFIFPGKSCDFLKNLVFQIK